MDYSINNNSGCSIRGINGFVKSFYRGGGTTPQENSNHKFSDLRHNSYSSKPSPRQYVSSTVSKRAQLYSGSPNGSILNNNTNNKASSYTGRRHYTTGAFEFDANSYQRPNASLVASINSSQSFLNDGGGGVKRNGSSKYQYSPHPARKKQDNLSMNGAAGASRNHQPESLGRGATVNGFHPEIAPPWTLYKKEAFRYAYPTTTTICPSPPQTTTKPSYNGIPAVVGAKLVGIVEPIQLNEHAYKRATVMDFPEERQRSNFDKSFTKPSNRSRSLSPKRALSSVAAADNTKNGFNNGNGKSGHLTNFLYNGLNQLTLDTNNHEVINPNPSKPPPPIKHYYYCGVSDPNHVHHLRGSDPKFTAITPHNNNGAMNDASCDIYTLPSRNRVVPTNANAADRQYLYAVDDEEYKMETHEAPIPPRRRMSFAHVTTATNTGLLSQNSIVNSGAPRFKDAKKNDDSYSYHRIARYNNGHPETNPNLFTTRDDENRLSIPKHFAAAKKESEATAFPENLNALLAFAEVADCYGDRSAKLTHLRAPPSTATFTFGPRYVRLQETPLAYEVVTRRRSDHSASSAPTINIPVQYVNTSSNKFPALLTRPLKRTLSKLIGNGNDSAAPSGVNRTIPKYEPPLDYRPRNTPPSAAPPFKNSILYPRTLYSSSHCSNGGTNSKITTQSIARPHNTSSPYSLAPTTTTTSYYSRQLPRVSSFTSGMISPPYWLNEHRSAAGHLPLPYANGVVTEGGSATGRYHSYSQPNSGFNSPHETFLRGSKDDNTFYPRTDTFCSKSPQGQFLKKEDDFTTLLTKIRALCKSGNNNNSNSKISQPIGDDENFDVKSSFEPISTVFGSALSSHSEPPSGLVMATRPPVTSEASLPSGHDGNTLSNGYRGENQTEVILPAANEDFFRNNSWKNHEFEHSCFSPSLLHSPFSVLDRVKKIENLNTTTKTGDNIPPPPTAIGSGSSPMNVTRSKNNNLKRSASFIISPSGSGGSDASSFSHNRYGGVPGSSNRSYSSPDDLPGKGSNQFRSPTTATRISCKKKGILKNNNNNNHQVNAVPDSLSTTRCHGNELDKIMLQTVSSIDDINHNHPIPASSNTTCFALECPTVAPVANPFGNNNSSSNNGMKSMNIEDDSSDTSQGRHYRRTLSPNNINTNKRAKSVRFSNMVKQQLIPNELEDSPANAHGCSRPIIGDTAEQQYLYSIPPNPSIIIQEQQPPISLTTTTPSSLRLQHSYVIPRPKITPSTADTNFYPNTIVEP